MGAFNVLNVSCRCPKCGAEVECRLQFKYGDTWQYEYRLGDTLRWGGNDIGRQGAKRVVLDAPAEPCRRCGFETDYEIFVENDELRSFQAASGEYDFVGRQDSFIVLDAPGED